jgi:hypothetical protein
MSLEYQPLLVLQLSRVKSIYQIQILYWEKALAQIITELNSQPPKYSKTMQVLKLLVEQVELPLEVMVQIPGQM